MKIRDDAALFFGLDGVCSASRACWLAGPVVGVLPWRLEAGVTNLSARVEANEMKRKASSSISMICLAFALICSGCFKSACATGQHAPAYQAAGAGAERIPSSDDEVPAGFVEMEVAGVLPTAQGNAVFLSDAENETVLPIWIGPSEAMAIQLRMERRRFERPLTHDLLDSLVKELGGRVLRIHVDDLKGSTFVATVFVQANDKVLSIDARPSDAIALAVGNRAPIYVSSDVVDRAGMGGDDLPSDPHDVPHFEEYLPEGHELRERDEAGVIGPPPTQSL